LGIKVPDALHAQFALVAQLDGISLGDAAIRAVELYVSAKKAEPDFAARAQAALEEIEREAAARRGVIQGLLGADGDVAVDKSAARGAEDRGRQLTTVSSTSQRGGRQAYAAAHHAGYTIQRVCCKNHSTEAGDVKTDVGQAFLAASRQRIGLPFLAP
jgi:hypothetical protein